MFEFNYLLQCIGHIKQEKISIFCIHVIEMM